MPLKDDVQNWNPMFIGQSVADSGGHIVTADQWNNYWNLIRTQGDNSAQALHNLRNLLFETIYDAENAAESISFSYLDMLATNVSDALKELETMHNADVLALQAHWTSNDHDGRYNTKAETTSALALKANLASPTFTGTVGGITKAMVGLGNVDNTADINKPISTATQAALDLKATVAALLLKADASALEALVAALTSHKTSGDHDARYLAKDNTKYFRPDGQEEPATKGYVDETLAGAVLGQIADKSLGDPKFQDEYKHGGLSNLDPAIVGTDRASLVAALNYVLANASMSAEDILAALLTVDGAASGLDAQYLAGKSAPAGDIVGTTATQTLTDKTLTSPVINNIVTTVSQPPATFPANSHGTVFVMNTTTQTLTNKTLSRPKITSSGSIDDSNGNELIKFPATVGSAVNEVTVTNAATGNAPGFIASGGDANININNTPKGTGRLQEAGENVARFKNVTGASFNSGTTTKVITDSWVTANTLIIVSPTGTAKGQWSVVSAAGSFTITSTVAETVAVAFDWAGVK